jgi:hypothetical protein
MQLSEQKIEQLKRSIQLALNHEWPELSRISGRIAQIESSSIPRCFPVKTALPSPDSCSAAFFSITSAISRTRPARASAQTRSRPALPREPLFALVDDALAKNPQVWIYPVGRLNGHEHPKHIVFSVDYLKNAVLSLVDRDRKLKTLLAERPAFNEEFKALIEGRLKELGGKFGFAVLVGIKRPVCVLSESKVRPADTKLPRPETIDVDETL